MKRLLFLCLCILLLCSACTSEVIDPSEDSSGETAPTSEDQVSQIPQDLLGVWVSADPGELDMVETITFASDGYLEVNLKYQGSDYGTVSGSYTVEGRTILCSITDGADPYRVEYSYQIDGRMLILYDDDGPAEYLRTS